MQLIRSIIRVGQEFLARRTAADDFKPGQYDEIALKELRATVALAPLGTMTVLDLAPEFVMEKQEGLTWEEAVAEANRRFGEKQPERALFLRKYLSPGMPGISMDELQWPPAPDSFPGPTTYGHWEWWGSEIHAKLREARERNGGDWHKEAIAETKDAIVLAIISTVIANDVLTAAPSLAFANTDFKGVAFFLFCFDGDDRLTDVCREVAIRSAGVRLDISCLSASDHYSVNITDRHQNAESLEYSSDLLLLKRSVRAQKRLLFYEIYKGGRLRKRVHPGDPSRVDEAGDNDERVEEFP